MLLVGLASACTLADRKLEIPEQLYAAEIQMLDSLSAVLNLDFSKELFEEVIAQTRSLTQADSLSPLYAYGLMYEAWFNATFQRYQQAQQLFAIGYEKSEALGLWHLEVQMAPAAVFMFVNLAEPERARQIYQRLLSLRAEHQFDSRQQNLFKTAQATWLQSQNQMAEALELYFEVVDWFENVGDAFYISSIYNSIGLVLSQTGNYEGALVWFRKALDRQYVQQHVENIDRTLNNMGFVYRRLGDYERAIEYLNAAKLVNEEHGRTLSVIRNLYNIGRAYAQSEAWDQALATFQEGYELSAANELKPGLAFHQFGIATVSYEKGDPPAVTLGILYGLEAMMLRNNIRSNAVEVYRMLHELEEASGNYAASLRWYKLYHEQVLLTDAEERKLAIENVLIQNQLEREKEENQYLRKSIELKRQAELSFILILMVLLLLIAVALGFLLFYRYSSTELKKANNQLLSQSESISAQNQRLEELAQERQRLINTIIHDLRNPLSIIESLDELFDPRDPEGCAEMKEIMSQSAVKMRQIVNSLLTVFEAESTDISNQLSELEIDQLIQDIVQEFRPLAAKKNIELLCRAEPLKMVSHAPSLNSIASNLISNAVKYSYPGNKVTVTVKREGENWVLRVRDQGPGFLESERTKVFSLFAKLSAQPTGGESSIGVGLYAVKLSTERLGGQAALNWEYKDGAEFICTFPLRLPEQVVA